MVRYIISLLTILPLIAGAQIPQGMQGRNMNVGRIYGKVIDNATGKGLEFATVRLMITKFDSVSKAPKQNLVTGQITQSNGEFNLEQVPVFGKLTLIISAIGYQTYEQNIAFEKPTQGKMPVFEKDLGNIRIKPDSVLLKEVVVDGSEPLVKMAIDKKVFNVEKNIVSEGGTAEDVLKTVPSLSVDMDGNVTLRNASPQIFIDGKLSPLSIDQIPADAIQSVEVITNPSAKYDASGGMGGIVNIVLKKDRRIGFNGSVRAGVDMRGRINSNADLNIREGKFNFFISGNINQRRSISYSETTRNNLFGQTPTNLMQISNAVMDRQFMSARTGFDWFINNRSTITITQSLMRGDFNPKDNLNIITDSLFTNNPVSYFTDRTSNTNRYFNNFSTSLLFKHLFPKEGRELTADINYNGSRSASTNNFSTYNYDPNRTFINSVSQRQINKGSNDFLTAQADYITPLSETQKIETGIRFQYRDFTTLNENAVLNTNSDAFEIIPGLSNNYRFIDQVYAGYITYTQSIGKFGYQVGLRAESSDYVGTLISTNQSFRNQYPISLFPSTFVEYRINEKNNFQLNYSRRVNRPSFFNLIPFIDYSDSLNLSRGNPGLKPEFTHSIELSYLKDLGKNNSVLTSAYFKNSTNLITRYQLFEYNDVYDRMVLMNTYANANNSYAYGIELTIKNNIKKFIEVTTNINLFNSIINGNNIAANLENEMFSWFAKMNLNFRLPKNFSLQLSGDYRSKAALQMGGGGWGGHGGMGGWGGPSSSAQGYIGEKYSIDVAIKKDFWNRKASLTFNVSDVFKTEKNITHTESPLFIQDSWRIRDQRFFRVNFSYRFGKFDSSIFKRKNTRVNTDGMEMGM
ncbi:MAG: outer membrane beta-barrel protein [Bacteroidia bacterium]